MGWKGEKISLHYCGCFFVFCPLKNRSYESLIWDFKQIIRHLVKVCETGGIEMWSWRTLCLLCDFLHGNKDVLATQKNKKNTLMLLGWKFLVVGVNTALCFMLGWTMIMNNKNNEITYCSFLVLDYLLMSTVIHFLLHRVQLKKEDVVHSGSISTDWQSLSLRLIKRNQTSSVLLNSHVVSSGLAGSDCSTVWSRVSFCLCVMPILTKETDLINLKKKVQFLTNRMLPFRRDL